MFKKQIATDSRINTPSVHLITRETIFTSLFLGHTNGQIEINGAISNGAISKCKCSSDIKLFQRNTNSRLDELETILKEIFNFKGMTFATFCKKHEDIFKQRFRKIPASTSSKQKDNEHYDSDSELASSEKTDKKDTMKVLRLYLRLLIRKEELEAIVATSDPKVISYPKISTTTSESTRRGQQENNYSEIEAYIVNPSEKKLVLSKGSFLFQTETYPALFGEKSEEDSEKFLTEFMSILKNIKITTNPLQYIKQQPIYLNTPDTDDNRVYENFSLLGVDPFFNH